MQPGMQLSVLAKHDTYGISFEHGPGVGGEVLPNSSEFTAYRGPGADQADTSTYLENTDILEPRLHAKGLSSIIDANSGLALDSGVGTAVRSPAAGGGSTAGSSQGMDVRLAATGVPLKASNLAHITHISRISVLVSNV